MERLSWATQAPGSFETDLVHHCGPVTAGEYVHTLQLVDIATGWSERVAMLGRSQIAMVAAFRRVQERLPFPITHLHPDNGSEFFNDHLIRYFGEAMTGLHLSRSRPYRKNDNRFVEQKNATLVRAYLGYERLETPGQCTALNALYDQLWVYYNLFQPVLHLVGQEGGRREAPPPVGPGPDPLPATPGQQHPVLGAASEARHPLCRDKPSTATGSHLPRVGTAVGPPQGSPGTQPKGGGNDPSVTFLHELTRGL